MRWLTRIRRGLRGLLPRTFQGRLTVAFVSVIALTLALVTVLVVNRLDDYFATQEQRDLQSRLNTVSSIIQDVAHDAALGRPIVDAERGVAPAVAQAMRDEDLRSVVADELGQADVTVRFGHLASVDQQIVFVPAPDGQFQMDVLVAPGEGQTRESATTSNIYSAGTLFSPYAFQVTLTDPYTYRATAIANVTGLLAAITLAAMGLAVVVSAMLARRFTTPLRQLTDASRALAEGDLSRRVPVGPIRAGASELGVLAVQFNTMADRLEESVEIIRSDRDRSRDFLADVSHELRTPLAALRTFNQLLMESAGDDPDARAEFLESSAGQIDRLDWLAQNLLELSKLDSGLVLLDLRPDDLRAAVESAAHQHDATAARRGVKIIVELPEAPIRIHHDPPRIGQVVANLVGNAVKFTPRGGSVRVSVAPIATGARIDVADTGVGIESTELPHIFERFYRGSRANEARGSGSGLGLAIVRSIVDMHGGTVAVESGPGLGSRFTVTLPRDPRTVAGSPAAARSAVASAAEGSERVAATSPPSVATPASAATLPGGGSPEALEPNMTETSPSDASQMNPASAP